MDFQWLNDFLGSDVFVQLTNYLQMAALILVTYLSNRIKTKFNNLSSGYSDNLKVLKEKFSVTEDELNNTKQQLTSLKNTLSTYNNDVSTLSNMIVLFLLDSKSISATTKAAISKLSNKLSDTVQLDDVKEVINESKEEEKITVEDVEEIKEEQLEVQTQSTEAADSIAQQTQDIYNSIVNVE